jgi:hypothetical protein
MGEFERGIADVFASLEAWLSSSGATRSMLELSWAVLTFLWLVHVAATMRPGRPPDLVGTFGRLLVSAGLLSAVGSLNDIIIRAFETLRDAGSAILLGLIGQNWSELFQQWFPQGLFQLGPWFSHPLGMVLLLGGILVGVLLFAIGLMVYLAILFFAHLTLLLAIFLAPLAMALLAAPGTARWTARWAAVIVRTGLVVFSVRVIHAAAIYLAIIVPVRQISTGLRNGLGGLGGDLTAAGILFGNVISMLVLMLVGTGIGVYAMLRAERLTGQFVDGVAFSEGLFAWPLRVGSRLAAGEGRSASTGPPPGSVAAAIAPEATQLWDARGGAAQQATVIMPNRRSS